MVTKLPNEEKLYSPGEAYEAAHAVDKGDPRIDGPYLDDLRAAQEDEYRRQRNKGISQIRDEDTNKKKDVPFEDFRAISQQQHDENRYHEEKTVTESVKAERKKTPKNAVEKAWNDDTPLPATKSKKRAVKKADRYKGKDQRGDTPAVKVQQKKAKTVSDQAAQPSNAVKEHKVEESKQPEVSPAKKAVGTRRGTKDAPTPKSEVRNRSVAKKTAAKKAATTRPDSRAQGSVKGL